MMAMAWQKTRLKYIADCNRRVLPESTKGDRSFKYIDIGAVAQGSIIIPEESISFVDAPSRARRLAEPGDIIISTVRTYLRAVATVPDVDDDLVFSTGFAVLHPRDVVNLDYLAYVLQGDEFVDKVVANSAGVSYPAITASDLMALDLLLPPLEEQRAIADYLDQETAQIDALVAKQEEFIGLLRERRTHAREVLASHVSTGPRLRWTLHEVDFRAGTRAIELPLFSVSIDWGVRRRDETTDKLSRAEELDHYKVCLKGDIVINRMRAFQGALGVAPADGVVSPDYAVLRAKHNVDSEWLAELMRTKAFVSEIIQRLRGIGGTSSGNVRTPRINTADLLDIRAHIPTAIVQQAELTTLTEESKRIDALIAKAEEHIALAKERRSALITAAVTGQFDVRTAKKGARV